ncbi:MULTISPECIES: HlyD family efflux transporter periplasmic adaptor subunit [unclassified Caballeronia]|uniref:HlyD family efflux transporter periplasmic adaptor subunit n=1 Tax=unclassified Caballeronia TaxID=2646786 RepID=UPI00285DD5DB|nr:MULTISPECIES: HlyD family efflux transporter periplasmic adaptor subunit [unclassified Caballeronia]MDR5823797.1 HlyD family efflux transporter periplasmic adaptor subunit [Caballeronia sp. LZ043]MDR5881693.1 HlyD family efflux transporter periplasmic adaptor subunit [Caballeronia sp. LZ032]
MNSPASPAPVKAARRKWLLTLILAVAVLAGIGWGVYYLLVARYHIETDDAYVDGNIVQITPQTSGTVIAVNANDTQLVSVGDTVVQIDPADARIALKQAEADLGQTVRRTRGLYVDNDLYRAQIEQRQSDLAKAQADLRRRLDTGTSGAVSQEDVSHAREAVVSAQAALDAARQQLNANLALTANTTIADHPDVLSSATRVRDAWLGYARTTLPAPVTGYVAQRSVQVGQRVSPGMPLMSIVPLDQVWVDANFKEVQLRHIRMGQAVDLTADVYGSSVVYHGKVVGVTPGTGSALALLPAQNATGNWIKIVQRLAVRIGIPAEELRKHPLRVGLSMNADVDVKNTSGAQVSTMPVLAAGAADRTDVFARYGEEAEAAIARIVDHNK